MQDILEAFEFGQTVGEIIETILQPYIDEHEPGAGHLGEEYLHFINEHNFDPIHPLDLLHGHAAVLWDKNTDPYVQKKFIEEVHALSIQKRPAGALKGADQKKPLMPRYTRASQAESTALPEKPAETAFGITIWRLRTPVPDDRDGARLLVQDNPSSAAKEYVAQRLEPDARLREGDRVRLGIEVPRSGFLYVVDRETYQDGAVGEPVLLLPTLDFNRGDNRVEPGRLIEIPSENSDVQALKHAEQARAYRGKT